jgi:hypothetical protein
MTGAYMRVKRDGKWENIEVEFLTDKEREETFRHRDNSELRKWINLLCKTLTRIDGIMRDAGVITEGRSQKDAAK